MGDKDKAGNSAVRRRAVEMLEAGVGRRYLARELGISDATARQWTRAYAVGGSEAVLNAGSHRKVYDYETKLAAVKDHLEHGKSVREVMVKYQIPSESSVKAWCRAYTREGAAALVNKRRGRKPKAAPASESHGAESPKDGEA